MMNSGALTALKQKIKVTVPDAHLITFTSPETALQYAKEAKKWFRQFMIDTKKRAVYRVDNQEAGDLVSLSPIEYSILLTMTEHRDEVILYDQLYKSVWNQDDIGDVRTLMVHVSNLRKKIDLNHTDMIRSIRGFGYMFQDT